MIEKIEDIRARALENHHASWQSFVEYTDDLFYKINGVVNNKLKDGPDHSYYMLALKSNYNNGPNNYFDYKSIDGYHLDFETPELITCIELTSPYSSENYAVKARWNNILMFHRTGSVSSDVVLTHKPGTITSQKRETFIGCNIIRVKTDSDHLQKFCEMLEMHLTIKRNIYWIVNNGK